MYRRVTLLETIALVRQAPFNKDILPRKVPLRKKPADRRWLKIRPMPRKYKTWLIFGGNWKPRQFRYSFFVIFYSVHIEDETSSVDSKLIKSDDGSIKITTSQEILTGTLGQLFFNIRYLITLVSLYSFVFCLLELRIRWRDKFDITNRSFAFSQIQKGKEHTYRQYYKMPEFTVERFNICEQRSVRETATFARETAQSENQGPQKNTKSCLRRRFLILWN